MIPNVHFMEKALARERAMSTKLSTISISFCGSMDSGVIVFNTAIVPVLCSSPFPGLIADRAGRGRGTFDQLGHVVLSSLTGVGRACETRPTKGDDDRQPAL